MGAANGAAGGQAPPPGCDRQSGGTGLGLAIADRVIRIHGGTIRAENAADGGLRVEIVLPGVTASGGNGASAETA